MAAVIVYSLVSAPVAAQEKKERPYHSQDADLEFILQRYHEKNPKIPKCDWGEPWEINENITVRVEEECLGGQVEPELYRVEFVREKGVRKEIFLENMEGKKKMNEYPMFLSLSDRYREEKRGKVIKDYTFGLDLTRKQKKYANRRYVVVIKEAKRAAKKKQKKN